MTNAMIEADEICLNVTLLDGMILTRSAFHHSVNYRSAVIFGKVRELTTDEEKLEGLETLINHFVPGRWEHCRKPNDNELKATRVIAVDIITASAKVKNTGPGDNNEDLGLDYWAGTIPLKHNVVMPFPDEHVPDNMPVPQHVLNYYEKNKNGL